MYQNIYYNRTNGMVDIWDDEKGHYRFRYTPYCYKKVDCETNLKSIYGDFVTKINIKDKKDDDVLFESDLQGETRLLVDTYYASDTPPKTLKICFIDIETDSKNGFPNMDTFDKAIISIACRDFNEKKTYVFLLDKYNKFTTKNTDDTFFCVCKTEQELLLNFIKFFSHQKYHIVSGWNSEKFDVLYIIKRSAIVVESNYKFLSPINIVEEVEFAGFKKQIIAGVSCLDFMELYKKFSIGERVSYSLNETAKFELQKSKTEYEGTLAQLYENDINKFIEYNIQDTLLIEDLENKLQYIKTAVNICHKGHIPYDQIYMQSRILEGAILTYLRKNNLVASDKPKLNGRTKDEVIGTITNWKELKKQIIVTPTENGYNVDVSNLANDAVIECEHLKFTKQQIEVLIANKKLQINTRGGVKLLAESGEGAYVKEPLFGRYNWIIDLDFTSLYPSIIRSLNISPETQFGYVQNWKLKNDTTTEFILIPNDSNKHYTTNKNDLIRLMDTYNFKISGNGVLFKQNKRGIIPSILDLWFAERLEYQRLSTEALANNNIELSKQYDVLDYITKILLNSMYGVFLSPSFRFYNKNNGESVTISGQSLVKEAERLVNEFLNKKLNNESFKDYVVLIDTDSTMVSVESFANNEEEVKTLALELQQHVNSMLTPFVKKQMHINDNHFFEMKQEMIAISGFFLKPKKRYALHIINKKGKHKNELEIKGIPIIRTDFPLYFRTTLKPIIQKILDGENQQYIDQMVLKIKDEMKIQPLSQIGIPTGVKNVDKFFDKNYINDPKKRYLKKAPIYSKAAINHNILLEKFNLTQFSEPIRNGDKIKYIFVNNNEYGFETIAFKEDSPKQILDYLQSIINYDRLFARVVANKLVTFYEALNWKYNNLNGELDNEIDKISCE